MDTKSFNTLGFWEYRGHFLSSVLIKKDIPKWARIELVRNRYQGKDPKKPHYVGYFVPAKESNRVKDINHVAFLHRLSGEIITGELIRFIDDNADTIRDAFEYGVDTYEPLRQICKGFAEHIADMAAGAR